MVVNMIKKRILEGEESNLKAKRYLLESFIEGEVLA